MAECGLGTPLRTLLSDDFHGHWPCWGKTDPNVEVTQTYPSKLLFCAFSTHMLMLHRFACSARNCMHCRRTVHRRKCLCRRSVATVTHHCIEQQLSMRFTHLMPLSSCHQVFCERGQDGGRLPSWIYYVCVRTTHITGMYQLGEHSWKIFHGIFSHWLV